MDSLLWEEVAEVPNSQDNQMERDAAYQFATCRAKVPGGWLVRSWWQAENTNDRAMAMVFVPEVK